MFTRRDVWKLTDEDPWHPILLWYARAVGELQSRDGTDFSDPTCWRYLAEIHGTEIDRSRWPAGATWDECDHGSWFFLSWHRVYLHYFEKVVRQAVRDLGGPADQWALPYWDYSDPRRPGTRMLPPAFREAVLPGGGRNPLRIDQRDPDLNDGTRGLLEDSVDIHEAMLERDFAGVQGRPSFGGGAVARRWHGGRFPGTLEVVPHGLVHNDVAGIDGWMGAFETAARDPVFWVHHANVDRLWEMWLAQGSGRVNPPDSAWLGMPFTIGQGAPAVTLAARDVLDTRASPLEYEYESVALPAPAPGTFASIRTEAAPPAERMRMRDDTPPEMIGASEQPVPLATAPSYVDVTVVEPTLRGPALRGENAVPRMFLRVENVQGRLPAAPGYAVYVNLPEGANPAAHPERRVGTVSTFGVREASGGGEHGGDGLTFAFDITDVAQRLQREGDWEPRRLRITFTPLAARRGLVLRGQAESDLTVGRVSVYAE